MQEIIEIRANYLAILAQDSPPSLLSMAELVIIHADGMDYKSHKGKEGKTTILAKRRIKETRLVCSEKMLELMITDLQLHLQNVKSVGSGLNILNEAVNKK